MFWVDDPVLHVGDRIRIVCPEVPELCVDRSIGPDGTIDLPAVGPLPAAIRRTSDLGKEISLRLPGGQFPPLVEVRWLGSPAGTVSIEGSVKTPLQLFAPGGISTERLLAAAFALPEADVSILALPLKVAAGSRIVVPTISAERRINVLGAVNDPRALPPADNLTLSAAIQAAGGLGAHADANAIVIVRAGESIPAQLPVDANFRLKPGDLIRVGLSANRHFIIVQGLVERPGTIEYAPGMTASRAFAAAGGLQDKAKQGTLVWQTGPKTFRLSIAFLLAGRIPDPVIGPEDTLIVEATKP